MHKLPAFSPMTTRPKKIWQALILLAALLCATAQAQVYRCTVGQQTVYQDHPCGSANTAIATPQTTLGGLRDTEKAWIKQNQQQRPARSHRPAKRDDTHTESKACWKKHHQLKAVDAQLRQGYKPVQGEKLKRERAKYQDFLQRFCP